MFRQLIKKYVFQTKQVDHDPVISEVPPAESSVVAKDSPPFSSPEFDSLLRQVSSGSMPPSSDFLPFLNLEKRQHRAEVNFRLAEACMASGNLSQGKIFISRAWQLSNFSEQYLPLLENFLMQTKDAASLREAYKRIGIEAANKSIVSTAIKYFDLWHQSDVMVFRADKYVYDYDVLYALQRLAGPFQYHFSNTAKWAVPTSNRKIRLGYLLHGVKYTNSILMKILETLAKYHDSSKFELFFFCPEAEDKVNESPQGDLWLQKFKEYGATFCAPYIENSDLAQTLVECGRQIDNANLDLLVTSAALADFSHFFVSCLKPAPLLIGLIQGPPSRFASPFFDWCISWSQHPQIDTPVDCSLVNFSRLDPTRVTESSLTRDDIGVPESACILISSGRLAKFQDVRQWQIVSEILKMRPNVHYVVVGCPGDGVLVFEEVVPVELRSRIHFLGWREDVLNVLRLGDILLDTYPSGGGQALVEGMLSGLPVVGFQNDYLQRFDQDNWRPLQDFVGDLETVVPPGNFEKFKSTIVALIDDVSYRQKIADLCLSKTRARSTEASVAQAVADCESIYEKVLVSRGMSLD